MSFHIEKYFSATVRKTNIAPNCCFVRKQEPFPRFVYKVIKSNKPACTVFNGPFSALGILNYETNRLLQRKASIFII
jgi:hypothetical protein